MACNLSKSPGFLVLVTICMASPLDECNDPQACPLSSTGLSETDRESLLQLAMNPAQDNSLSDRPALGTCTPLANKGSHFTAAVRVGTPPQLFDLVADTGSDNLIVASCICQERFTCASRDKCFRGTNRSSSFHIDESSDGATVPKDMLSITFGSGVVDTAIASDIVKVGARTANMHGSLLLMIRKNLDFNTAFEGILGLGLPVSQQSMKDSHLSMSMKGFMEAANVARFGVCFNAESDGVLRISQAAPAEQLGVVGGTHWALGMNRLAFGDEFAPSSLCTRPSKPCVAVIDSGTTLITAPKLHIESLFADICRHWHRCRSSSNGLLQDTQQLAHAFQKLLLGCNKFMTDSHGLDEELPNIHFHLTGRNGEQRKLTMPGASYVYETLKDEIAYVHENLFGIFPVDIPIPTGKKKTVCTPAFGIKNMGNMSDDFRGPVWIFGLPVFYEFQVGYELSSNSPSLSFTKEPCGTCEKGIVRSAPVSLVGQKSVSKRPVLVRGRARWPSIDFSKPL